ncbi:hypothetical protein [Thermostichus sp. MS-CIW-26]|jgi:hypothetical protein
MASVRGWLMASLIGAATVVGGAAAWAQSRSLWLLNGQSTVVTGYFYRGENIWAQCDQDCFDVDLVLYDASGQVVAADELLDDFPIVQAPYEGNFSVKVIMASCLHPSGCAVIVDSDYSF